jgi:hypothetical protein
MSATLPIASHWFSELISNHIFLQRKLYVVGLWIQNKNAGIVQIINSNKKRKTEKMNRVVVLRGRAAQGGDAGGEIPQQRACRRQCRSATRKEEDNRTCVTTSNWLQCKRQWVWMHRSWLPIAILQMRIRSTHVGWLIRGGLWPASWHGSTCPPQRLLAWGSPC